MSLLTTLPVIKEWGSNMSKNEVNTEMKQFLKEGGNILDLLEDSQIEKLGDYVALGSEVDDHSRELWLKRNLEAIDLIKHIEDPNLEVGASDTIGTKGSPYFKIRIFNMFYK